MIDAKEFLRQLDVAELERQYDATTDDREALLVLLRAARRRRNAAAEHTAPIADRQAVAK